MESASKANERVLPVAVDAGLVDASSAEEVEHGCAADALVPITWPWLVGYYLGIPLLLVILRPEVLPAEWIGRLRVYGATVLATVGIGAPLHAMYALVMPRWFERIGPSLWRLPVHAAVILACVFVGMRATKPLLMLVCNPHFVRDPFHESLIATIVALVVVGATTSYTRLLRHTRDTERREQQAQQAALRAELEALQARTNPHFLFNSLNVVASLIATDPACAEETLERLSGLFRYALDGSRRRSVKLAEELGACEDYLDVESLRFGERLRWSVDVDEALDEVRIPPLILQPLVENAVRHGIASRREGGEVRIVGRKDDEHLTLTVRDDGDGQSKHRGTGTSLADLGRRLAVAYGERATLDRQVTEDGHAVQLRLPLGGPTELAG